MLSLLVFLPVTAAVPLLHPRVPDRIARWWFVLVTASTLALAGGVWAAYDTPDPGQLDMVDRVTWVPQIGMSYHVGVDGLSLPLVVMTTAVFLACAVYALREDKRPRTQAALFLGLETTALGLFAAGDLILFFVFFDLSIVGMYLSIHGWGHGERRRSALLFFLYTFLGSLALLVGFIGLYVAAEPHTFDMVRLASSPPLEGRAAVMVLGAILLGLAVKTPTVPFHTWLPPAHTDAPTIGSVVLAAVLLKMGTYGFVRIGMPMLPDAWRAWSPILVAVGLVSVLWGALVALAQTDLKRMIAYTSVNHMGYVVLGLGAAGLAAGEQASARSTAVSGAVTQMVSHGLLTGALFMLAGVVWARGRDFTLTSYGGLAGVAPRFSVLMVIAALGSLGLPGLSGFVAELQIFIGAVAVVPIAAVGLLGILLMTAVLLTAVQQMVTGPRTTPTTGFPDLTRTEWLPVAGLLVTAIVLGLAPGPLLDVVEPAATALVDMVDR